MKKVACIMSRSFAGEKTPAKASFLLTFKEDQQGRKDLLGHTNIKTTERYTHVSKKDISKITSPLDKLKFKRENDK